MMIGEFLKIFNISLIPFIIIPTVGIKNLSKIDKVPNQGVHKQQIRINA